MCLSRVERDERLQAYEILQHGLPWEGYPPEMAAVLLKELLGMLAVDLGPARFQMSKRYGPLEVECAFKPAQTTLPDLAREVVEQFHRLYPNSESHEFYQQAREAYSAARVKHCALADSPVRQQAFERWLPVVGSPWPALWLAQKDLPLGREQDLMERLGLDRPATLEEALAASQALPAHLEESVEVEPIRDLPSELVAQARESLIRSGRNPHLDQVVATWSVRHSLAVDDLLLGYQLTGSILGLQHLSEEQRAELIRNDLEPASDPAPVFLEQFEWVQIGDTLIDRQ